MSRFEKMMTLMKEVPADIYAVLVLLIGAGLAIAGHKEEANMAIGGALAIFRGQSGGQK